MYEANQTLDLVIRFIRLIGKDLVISLFKFKGALPNWMSPAQLDRELTDRFPLSMTGRTMYVIPFSMGPLGSPLSKIGVQLTDSAYVAASMKIMTRMGSDVLHVLGDDDFVR